VKAWREQHPPEVPGLRVENVTDDSADLYIFDVIVGDDWWGGVSANSVKDELAKITAGTINVHVNSPGGDVFEAHAIYSLLTQHSANIVTYIDGLAASAASYIALAGDEVIMASNASMMIHDAISFTYGNEADHLQTAGMLGKQSEILAKLYADRSGGDALEYRAMMKAETWFTADEALEAGLVTSVTDAKRETTSNAVDPQVYGDAARAVAIKPSESTAPEGLADEDLSSIIKALEGAIA
jgi:ATP-dependent protease ClpP protease subunit